MVGGQGAVSAHTMVAHGAHACVGTESVERQCVLKAARKKERARSATTSTKRVFIQLLCLLAVSCSMGMCVLSGGLFDMIVRSVRRGNGFAWRFETYPRKI